MTICPILQILNSQERTGRVQSIPSATYTSLSCYLSLLCNLKQFETFQHTLQAELLQCTQRGLPCSDHPTKILIWFLLEPGVACIPRSPGTRFFADVRTNPKKSVRNTSVCPGFSLRTLLSIPSLKIQCLILLYFLMES